MSLLSSIDCPTIYIMIKFTSKEKQIFSNTAAVKKSYERITEKFLNELKIEERDPKIYMPKLKALPVNEIVEAIKTVGMVLRFLSNSKLLS